MDVAAPVGLEANQQHMLALGLRAGEVAQQRPVDRVALLLEDIHRERAIIGAQRRAVVEARLGSQHETIGKLVGGDADRLRHKSIHRVRFVGRTGHKRIEGRVHARRAIASERKDVQRVESLEILVSRRVLDLQAEHAALRRLRVHIRVVLEVRRQSEVAECRKPMDLGLFGKREAGARKSRCACSRELQGIPTRDGHGGASPKQVLTICRELCRFLAH